MLRSLPIDKDDLSRYGNIPDWMTRVMAVNPSYVCWGPGEDYMQSVDGRGWDSGFESDNWKEFSWSLDELNELVNFYFAVERSSKGCSSCGETGLNEATAKLDREWYDFENTGKCWSNALTQVEVDALKEAGRLRGVKATPEAVNGSSRGNGFFHDAINKWICVKARAEHLGVYGQCDACDGNGYIFVEDKCRLTLTLWMIHPRKGCSRGIFIKDVLEDDVSDVMTYLAGAAERNASRFRNAVDAANKTLVKT